MSKIFADPPSTKHQNQAQIIKRWLESTGEVCSVQGCNPHQNPHSKYETDSKFSIFLSLCFLARYQSCFVIIEAMSVGRQSKGAWYDAHKTRTGKHVVFRSDELVIRAFTWSWKYCCEILRDVSEALAYQALLMPYACHDHCYIRSTCSKDYEVFASWTLVPACNPDFV